MFSYLPASFRRLQQVPSERPWYGWKSGHDGNRKADTGEILTGWPTRLDAKDFSFSAMYNGWLVVSYVPMNKPLPQSNVFKSQVLEWKQNNCFTPLVYLKQCK